ncbi:Hypothetical protein R9X50_00438500 [Acrodontium crateriforme]|uniref:Heme haloperoxidase family profile domain-containing protein n=1 Tax=Acrodontium crateriforme TaxID=150365 RepID=A0AAQ3M5B2_9PEZI|nr:Hypothetical protein R9X50_00438500 [Acrodontium crateriforme]
MKTFALSAALLASQVAAFPKMDMRAMEALMTPETMKLAREIHQRRDVAPPQGAGAMPLVPPPFDAASQYVSTSGQYAFVAPGPTDARGPCPGLNALANHGYLPHNGVATIEQFVTATSQGFGMGADLATVLAVYGAVVDGSLTFWSIGGSPHVGISGSHGNYETDGSPLKGDLFQYGSNVNLQMSQFEELYAMQPNAATANYNLDVLRQFRHSRFDESIQKNPDYVFGPFTGMAVSQAAHTFIYRFMANKSAEYPEGILNKETLKSFMSITGPENNLKWTFGHERFPDNFYRRNDADAYTVPYFETDILYLAEVEPRILGVGCNKGAVNTYSVIDPAILTNGAYDADQIAASPLCFALEFATLELPGLTGLTSTLLAPLVDVLNQATTALNCKSIPAINNDALAVCPGLTVYGGPTAPVASGAIQS